MSNCRGVCVGGGGGGECPIKCPKREKYSVIFIKRIGGLFFSKICDLIPPPTIRLRRINTDIFTEKAKSYV